MDPWNRSENPKGLRIIRTARDQDSINEAARNGLWPLVRMIEPSDKIRSKYSVVQHKKTGEIKVIGDYREGFFPGGDGEFVVIIDWTFYYPHNFRSPFAAYLIPKDIAVGERVFIEDLIEDYVGESWNQGDTFRLESCEAIWNGSDFVVQHDPDKDSFELVG